MGVEGLWLGMLVGMCIQATFYTRLVIKTDWQEVADAAQRRIKDEQGLLHFNSFSSAGRAY